jgi:hypothetical protein
MPPRGCGIPGDDALKIEPLVEDWSHNGESWRTVWGWPSCG